MGIDISFTTKPCLLTVSRDGLTTYSKSDLCRTLGMASRHSCCPNVSSRSSLCWIVKCHVSEQYGALVPGKGAWWMVCISFDNALMIPAVGGGINTERATIRQSVKLPLYGSSCIIFHWISHPSAQVCRSHVRQVMCAPMHSSPMSCIPALHALETGSSSMPARAAWPHTPDTRQANG